jgi:hypothetical protein
MFGLRCRLLLKRIYNSFTMFTEDNLATAQIAQLFGSELLKVQQSATTDSGSQPDIVKLNPKQFLIKSEQYQSQKKVEDRRLIEMLQREAEASCPLPEQIQPISQPANPIQQAAPLQQQTQPISPGSSFNGDNLERIAKSLERIANRLEGLDLTVKKKRIKRISK